MKQYARVDLMGHVQAFGTVKPSRKFPGLIKLQPFHLSDVLPERARLIGPSAIFQIVPMCEKEAATQAIRWTHPGREVEFVSGRAIYLKAEEPAPVEVAPQAPIPAPYLECNGHEFLSGFWTCEHAGCNIRREEAHDNPCLTYSDEVPF